MGKENSIKRYFELFFIFFKIGAFTFGGGYAMIPLIEKVMVDEKGWVEKEEIVDLFAIAQSIPGAIAINSSSLIGYKIAGKRGALTSTFGVVLPSFLIISVIAGIFTKISDLPQVKAIFVGITASVVALILTASIKISKTAIKDKLTLMITIATVIAVVIFDINPIFIILAGALPGLLIYKFIPDKIEKFTNVDK
ncbi:chromate transporter [Maledivibacter halophilus]|uniref:Chromate transporter n=1 Tax=Maledivibacter halophilus TaxID=36842 RepID=A0A1T5M6U0_9FIRM|nr:chromate transporter [Maledivibacter halophilus]SKC83589.1 chromate transporter [Maledivibacter halophilus]